MTRFIQLHTLISYPPANLNRDDSGQPKTAIMGGTERLRVSSQSLKRAWRTSELFQQQLEDSIGTRTKQLGRDVLAAYRAAGVAEKQAVEWAGQVASVYGALKKDSAQLDIEQLVHVSPAERATLDALTARLAAEKRAATKEELDSLLHAQSAVDIAMFGRMLANEPKHNMEAAVQVAHAIGVHGSAIEDDYFTAVDDLNQDDPGAAHIGEAGFAAAVFYQYICIDRDLLAANLQDEALVERALRALIETALKVGPTGKQASFASRAYAHYALLEKGAQQPRSLSLAFVKPVSGGDYLVDSIKALRRVRENMDQVYGSCADQCVELNALDGQGSLVALLDAAVAP